MSDDFAFYWQANDEIEFDEIAAGASNKFVISNVASVTQFISNQLYIFISIYFHIKRLHFAYTPNFLNQKYLAVFIKVIETRNSKTFEFVKKRALLTFCALPHTHQLILGIDMSITIRHSMHV